MATWSFVRLFLIARSQELVTLGAAGLVLSAAVLVAAAGPTAAQPAAPVTITDYDENDWYLVRGQEKLSYHGMRECWVFNRAMVWLDKDCGVDGGILCYSSQSPLPLTGKRQVSRWYAGPDNDLATRQPVLQGDFRQMRVLHSLAAGHHFFLLVLPPPRLADMPTGAGYSSPSSSRPY